MKKKEKVRFARILTRCIAVECIVLVLVVVTSVLMKVTDKQNGGGKDAASTDASVQVHEIVTQNDVESNSVSLNLNENMVTSEDVETGELQETVTATVLTEEDKQLTEEEVQQLALEEQQAEQRRILFETADKLAKGYDYDAAIELIKDYEGDYSTYSELVSAVERYESEKELLDSYGAYEGVDEISHVFFHSLIADTSKAFDGDRMSNGYNYWMTTVDEFKSILEQMYEEGYVLVSIHDVAHEEVQEDGSTKMVSGEILLPSDKKPFVLSQDDVNYYEYMTEDGFAKRLVIDDSGFPACEIELDGETIIARDYDVVPILEAFIEEHPDFSYRGARGIIGVTGYEGVLGYRTNETDSDTYEADVKQATKVAERLKELGWEFASHSYGHGHMGEESAEYVKRDSEHWELAVAPIVGETDIYLFPYGEDIQESVATYSGAKYETLSGLGFRYFCGVYAYPWIQVNQQYVRMTRRNLDGYTMHFYPQRLADLFELETVFDSARPEFQ